MGVAQRPKALDRSVLGAGAVIAVFLILHHYWAYLSAPGTHDLTTAQRVAAINSALRHGDVAALRESGEMALLSRENIAHVGTSQCTGEPECYRIQRSRRGPDR